MDGLIVVSKKKGFIRSVATAITQAKKQMKAEPRIKRFRIVDPQGYTITITKD